MTKDWAAAAAGAGEVAAGAAAGVDSVEAAAGVDSVAELLPVDSPEAGGPPHGQAAAVGAMLGAAASTAAPHSALPAERGPVVARSPEAGQGSNQAPAPPSAVAREARGPVLASDSDRRLEQEPRDRALASCPRAAREARDPESAPA